MLFTRSESLWTVNFTKALSNMLRRKHNCTTRYLRQGYSGAMMQKVDLGIDDEGSEAEIPFA